MLNTSHMVSGALQILHFPKFSRQFSRQIFASSPYIELNFMILATLRQSAIKDLFVFGTLGKSVFDFLIISVSRDENNVHVWLCGVCSQFEFFL